MLLSQACTLRATAVIFMSCHPNVVLNKDIRAERERKIKLDPPSR